MSKAMYGGQAVIEGVMMAGPKGKAIAVRNEDGEIVYKIEDKPRLSEKNPKLKWPIIRGIAGFAASMVSGVKDLTWSAAQAGETEDDKLNAWDIVVAVGGAFVFAILFFVALPVFAGTFVRPYVGDFGRSLTEGLLRLILFLGYVIAIGRMNDIRRIFAYHGAEHKTINAYEAGVELTPENVRRYSRIHTRCGTSFLLMAMLLMIVVFTFVGQTDTAHRILIKILMLPLIAGFSYELFRLPLKHPRNVLVKILVAPGLAMQRLTTREPDLRMLEVAIAALKAVPGFAGEAAQEGAANAAYALWNETAADGPTIVLPDLAAFEKQTLAGAPLAESVPSAPELPEPEPEAPAEVPLEQPLPEPESGTGDLPETVWEGETQQPEPRPKRDYLAAGAALGLIFVNKITAGLKALGRQLKAWGRQSAPGLRQAAAWLKKQGLALKKQTLRLSAALLLSCRATAQKWQAESQRRKEAAEEAATQAQAEAAEKTAEETETVAEAQRSAETAAAARPAVEQIMSAAPAKKPEPPADAGPLPSDILAKQFREATEKLQLDTAACATEPSPAIEEAPAAEKTPAEKAPARPGPSSGQKKGGPGKSGGNQRKPNADPGKSGGNQGKSPGGQKKANSGGQKKSGQSGQTKTGQKKANSGGSGKKPGQGQKQTAKKEDNN